MRKYWSTILVLSIAALPPRAAAQQNPTQAGGPAVASADVAIGTGVADRQLTGTAESFPASTGAVYCYMKIENAADTEVEHVWYKADAEMARVKLNVRGSPWRTWSSKKLTEDSVGDWRCDVVQNGNVIKSVKFKVE